MESCNDAHAFVGRADEGDVVGDGEDADIFSLELNFAEYRVEAESEELHAQGVSLGAACAPGDDLGGAVASVIKQFCLVAVHGQEKRKRLASSVPIAGHDSSRDDIPGYLVEDT
jgi:hypothetical protein